MICKNCGYDHSHVVETKHITLKNQIKRRRECLKCGLRFTTLESLKQYDEKYYFRDIGK